MKLAGEFRPKKEDKVLIKNLVTYILKNDATMTSLVGNNIYPIIAPQGTDWPFVVVSTIDVTPSDFKDGVSTNDEYLFQVDIYAQTESECQTIASRVRTLLDDYTGTANSVQVSRIRFRGSEDSDFDIDLEIFAKSQEYRGLVIR